MNVDDEDYAHNKMKVKLNERKDKNGNEYILQSASHSN